MNISSDWKDLAAREVVIVTALLVGVFAAQPLLARMGVGYGILYPALFLYWLRVCFGACASARTRPHLHHDFHRVLTVLGTLLTILGSFWLFSEVPVPAVLAVLFLVAGVLVIASAQRVFGRPAGVWPPPDSGAPVPAPDRGIGPAPAGDPPVPPLK